MRNGQRARLMAHLSTQALRTGGRKVLMQGSEERGGEPLTGLKKQPKVYSGKFSPTIRMFVLPQTPMLKPMPYHDGVDRQPSGGAEGGVEPSRAGLLSHRRDPTGPPHPSPGVQETPSLRRKQVLNLQSPGPWTCQSSAL